MPRTSVFDMSFGKINHMDVITDTCTIRCRIIITEHR